MRNLRWDDLRLLLALFRQGSLKGAARDLGVNISTTSRRLDALEAAVGQHLFDRTTDGTSPTAAAELMLPFAESMEQAAHGMSQAVEGLEAEPEGVVRVTAPPGIADHFLAPAIAELLERYPAVRIEVVSSIGYADLTRREADIALRAMRPSSGDLVATRLGSAGYGVVASPGVAERLVRLRRPEQAAWITYGHDLAHLPEVSWVTSRVAPERIALRANSMTTQLAAVRAGIGVKVEVEPFAGHMGLVRLPLARPVARELAEIPAGSLWLVGHRALRQVPRIAVVWEQLERSFRAILGDSG